MFNKPTPAFDKFNNWKVGTPFGGGILIIVVVSVLTLWTYGILGIDIKPWEIFAILFTFIGFGLLGLQFSSSPHPVVLIVRRYERFLKN